MVYYNSIAATPKAAFISADQIPSNALGFTMNDTAQHMFNPHDSDGCKADAERIVTLLDMNSLAVARKLDGQIHESLSLLQKGLKACNIHMNNGLQERLNRFLQRLAQQPSLATVKSPCHMLSVLKRNTGTMILNSIHANSTSSSSTSFACFQDQDPGNTYALYDRLLVFGNVSQQIQQGLRESGGILSESFKLELAVVAQHIAPVLLYNMGLIIHAQAQVLDDRVVAHELYRYSLYLMEENSLQKRNHKSFDILLLALFNNLCEINAAFVKHSRVALCRERLLAVFVNVDLSQVQRGDFSFFSEQLVFSLEGFPTLAPAA